MKKAIYKPTNQKVIVLSEVNGYAKKSLDEIKEIVCAKLEDNIVKWNNIYALEIIVNDEPKNIYMTNGHLIELIAYLKLEEKVNA